MIVRIVIRSLTDAWKDGHKTTAAENVRREMLLREMVPETKGMSIGCEPYQDSASRELA
jgi:hypothetical protein